MDETVQALRRRVASGDASAEAPLLVARLRAAPPCERCGGDPAFKTLATGRTPSVQPCPACAGTGSTFRARMHLAAYAGHAAAQDAIGDRWRTEVAETQLAAAGLAVYRDGPGSPAALVGWVRGLSQWGPEPMQRAAVAAAALALGIWEQQSGSCSQCDGRGRWCNHCGGVGIEPDMDIPRKRVDTAYALLACPCTKHELELRALGRSVPTWSCLSGLFGTTPARTRDEAVAIVQLAMPTVGPLELREAIRFALVEWALA